MDLLLVLAVKDANLRIQQIDTTEVIVNKIILRSIIERELKRTDCAFKFTDYTIYIRNLLKPYKHYYKEMQNNDTIYHEFGMLYDLKYEEFSTKEPCFYYPLSINKGSNCFKYEERTQNGKYNYAYHKDNIYHYDNSKDNFTDEEVALLIKEFVYKKDRKFSLLKKQIALFESSDGIVRNNTRKPITEDVRFEVWRRDHGRCVRCGSNKNLEFDHIIPFSKGGSDSSRNIQLLCQDCNRSKSDKI